MIYLKETYTPPAPEDFEQAISVGVSIWDGLFALHPEFLAKRLSEYYRTDALFSRTINQIAEQALAEWEPKPTLAGAAGKALSQWWETAQMGRKFERIFKEFLIAGEIWCYLPLKSGVPAPRFLVPWQIEGVESQTGEAEDWTSARYLPGAETGSQNSRLLEITPSNTYYYAHDAIFANTRGTPPFGAMAPALERYRRWLTSRERITRMAGKVLGHLIFPTVEDAVASLGWRRANDGGLEPKPIKLPTDEAMVVTIGNGSDFRLVVPSVGGGDAAADGRAFYLQVIEASRLPEFMSGDGSNVNVATARVQYPFAVRSILALRDAFSRAMAGVCRLALERMGQATTEPITFDWPEMRELDYDLEANVLFQLYDRGLVAAQEVLSQLGYTGSAPGAVPPAAAAEAAKRAVESAVTAYLEGSGLTQS